MPHAPAMRRAPVSDAARLGDSDRRGFHSVSLSDTDLESGEISTEYADIDLESEEVPRQLDTAKSPPTAHKAGMVLSKHQGSDHLGEVMPFTGCGFIL